MPERITSTYESPPVTEVAILVQFQRLATVRNADFVSLWSETSLKGRYPSIEEYAELPPFHETFAGAPPRQFKMSVEPTVLRYNFRNADRQEQFQVQRDRAGFYWQSGQPQQPYPRFEYALEGFLRDLDTFQTYIGERALGEILPNQCALSYRNRIPRGFGWERPEELAQVVTFWRPEYTEPPPSSVRLESVAAMHSYVIVDSADKPHARMYVTMNETASPPDNFEGVELELIVRGAPLTPDRDGVVRFVRMAHEHIVQMFDSVTTATMQAKWKKK